MADPPVWLRAHDLSPLGQRVYSWTDASLDGANATARTAGRSPSDVADAIGGLPVVRFDGTARLGVALNVFAAPRRPKTVFLVFQSDDHQSDDHQSDDHQSDDHDAHLIGAVDDRPGDLTTHGLGLGLRGGEPFAKSSLGNNGVVALKYGLTRRGPLGCDGELGGPQMGACQIQWRRDDRHGRGSWGGGAQLIDGAAGQYLHSLGDPGEHAAPRAALDGGLRGRRLCGHP